MAYSSLRRASALVLPFALLAASPVLAADPPVKVSSPQAVKGTQAVVVSAFNVGFIFESVDNGKATGGMIGAFGGTTKAKSELVGVTPEMMQAITDAAYADFAAQLTAKGFTVAPSSTMFSAPSFSRVKTIPAPYEHTVPLEKNSKGKVTFYKPSALPGIVLYPGDFAASGFNGMGTAMTAGANMGGLAEYAKASGQAVIDVVYLIDFSQVKRPGAFSFGGIKVNSGMAVVDEYSKLNIISAAGKTATILIKQPVAVEGDFADMNDTTKGKGMQSAMNVAGGVAAAMGFGGLKFGKTRTYTFTAKPGPYQEGATKAATLANTVVVDQLAALR